MEVSGGNKISSREGAIDIQTQKLHSETHNYVCKTLKLVMEGTF